MTYIIDDVLVYRPADGIIKNLNTSFENGTILTPVLNRILLLLIEKQGEVITKNDFLEKVWEEYGLEGSTNTLTQYISNLRKILEGYSGISQHIITIPKTGYSLASELKIQIIKDEASLGKESSESVLPSGRGKSYRLIVAAVFVGVTLVTGPACLLMKTNNYIIHQQPGKLLFDYNGCEVLALEDKNHPELDLASISIAKAIIHENALNCENGVRFYFSMDDGVLNNVPGNVMISRCIENNTSKDSCITFQYNRW